MSVEDAFRKARLVLASTGTPLGLWPCPIRFWWIWFLVGSIACAKAPQVTEPPQSEEELEGGSGGEAGKRVFAQSGAAAMAAFDLLRGGQSSGGASALGGSANETGGTEDSGGAESGEGSDSGGARGSGGADGSGGAESAGGSENTGGVNASGGVTVGGTSSDSTGMTGGALGHGGASSSGGSGQDGTQVAEELCQAINAYRQQNGAAAVPLSETLFRVARLHAEDLTSHVADCPEVATRSWSTTDGSSWKGCCYTSAKAECMWDKPKEISGGAYTGSGYETVSMVGTNKTASDILGAWQQSSGVVNLLLNKSPWDTQAYSPWPAMGCGYFGAYASVWFGDRTDSAVHAP